MSVQRSLQRRLKANHSVQRPSPEKKKACSPFCTGLVPEAKADGQAAYMLTGSEGCPKSDTLTIAVRHAKKLTLQAAAV
eukprot:scaffold576351_cov18-Prasinocladus_malaysianus.AAC.1